MSASGLGGDGYQLRSITSHEPGQHLFRYRKVALADVSRNATALDGGRVEKEIAVRDVPEDEIIVWQTALIQCA